MNTGIKILMALLLSYSSHGVAQTLDLYFKIAAENNPGLKADYKEYEVALQKILQLNDLPDPILSFSYFLSPVETKAGLQQARLSLSQTFPWFGTLKAQGQVAALMAEARFESFVDARNKLYLKVASAYYPLYEVRKWIQIEEDNINILQSYKSIATRKFENGIVSMTDVLRVDVLIDDATTNLEILRIKEKPLVTAFNQVLNRSADEFVYISDTLSAMPLTSVRPDSIIQINPLVKSLELKQEASRVSEQVARKKGLPRFGVGIDYVVVGKQPGVSMPDNGKDMVMPMVSVSVPVFRKKYKASVKEAKLMQDIYTYQKEETINMLSTEYEMAWFEMQKELQMMSLYEKQVHSTNQILNLLLSDYGNSGKEFEEVLRTQQKLLQYKKMHIAAMVEYQLTVAKINYLTSKNNSDENNR